MDEKEEASILAAVDHLGGSSQRIRNHGLEVIQRVFGRQADLSVTEEPEDIAFHKIFDALFRIVRNARSAWLKASSANAKSSASSTLTVTSTALRVIVEASRTRLKFKTATAVLDHVLTIISDDDDDDKLLELLRNDYLRTFRLIIEIPAYTEHLRAKQWRNYVKLLIDILSSENTEYDTFDQSGQVVASFSRSEQQSLRMSQRNGGRPFKRLGTIYHDEVLLSLSILTGTPGTPVLSMAAEVCDSIFSCLIHITKATDFAAAAAFEILNHVLDVVLTEDIRLAQSIYIRAVPFIRRLWSTRSSSLRDQLIITLLSCRPLLIAQEGYFPAISSAITRPLYDALLSEYSERSQSEQLQVEDVRLCQPSSDFPLGLQLLEPRMNSSRSMSCWSLLSILASLTLVLNNHERRGPPADAIELSKKRQRLEDPPDALLQRALSSSGNNKIAALQIILFMLDQPMPLSSMFVGQLGTLVSQLVGGDSASKFWTSLIFSRLASIPSMQAQSLLHVWQTVYDTARKLALDPLVSRAACSLLQSCCTHRQQKFTGIEDDMSLLVSKHSESLPLTDAALDLVATVLTSVLKNTALRGEYSLKVLEWLNSRWILPSVLDRGCNMNTAQYVRPASICRLLYAMNGTEIVLQSPKIQLCTNVVYQAIVRLSRHERFTYFMLDVEKDTNATTTETAYMSIPGTSLVHASTLDLLASRLSMFSESWYTLLAERESNISPDIVNILTTLCIVSFAISEKLGGSSTQWMHMTEQLADTWKKVCSFTTKQEPKSQEPYMTIICQRALELSEARDQANLPLLILPGRDDFTTPFLHLCTAALATSSAPSLLDEEFSDAQDSWRSQNSQLMNSVSGTASIRRADPFSNNYRGFVTACATQLELGKIATQLVSNSTSSLIDWVLKLTSEELIAARGVLVSYFTNHVNLGRIATAQLLHHLAGKCLQDEEYDRCEPALVLILQISSTMEALWSSQEDDALTEVAFDIYNFAVANIVIVKKPVVSSEVVIEFAGLLNTILRVNPAYATDDLPSPRTSLLRILGSGMNRVKYHLSGMLCDLFDRYVLDLHTAILDDVMKNLPKDDNDPQAMAVRILLISDIGARWHTVLRQTVYHIYEMAAHIPSISPLAETCLQKICVATKAESCQVLFGLFAPQILYTWLGMNTISSMPAQAFGFDSVKSMIEQNLSEFVSQTALRGAEELADELSQITEVSWSDLLRDAVCRAEAYALASEISLAPKDRLFDGSEPKIRKQLSGEIHTQLLRDRYPEIFANLLLILQDDKGIDRALEKAGYQQELASWTEIQAYAQSAVQPPLSQQPSFRARHLIDECHYLHTRTGLTKAASASSAVLVHVYRKLLSSISPTLGPLHTCSVLRRLRIAVCLGGSVALRGYPLEMLLHNLRPFVTVFHCSEDAISLFWFLLRHGRDYLRRKLSFVAGLCLSVFASLSEFVSSSQDSTTQEAHFLSTMSKAQDFRKWMGGFLTGFTSEELTDSKSKLFNKIVAFAQSITRSGNNSKGTAEASLICCLLQDRTSVEPLLTLHDFDQALTILTTNFDMTENPVADVVESDEQAVHFAPILQGLLDRMTLNDAFRGWAGYIIGRAYICTGETERRVVMQDAVADAKLAISDAPELTSYRKIIESLSSRVWTEDLKNAATIESTLQNIATTLTRSDQAEIVGTDQSDLFLDDLRFESFTVPELTATHGIADMDEALAILKEERSSDKWAARLVIALCSSADEDPVLGYLPHLTQRVPSIGPSILPYVVHLVLNSEFNSHRKCAARLSTLFSQTLQLEGNTLPAVSRFIISSVLYLRGCKLPSERHMSQRNEWLDLDFTDLARAASRCQMWQAALLFAELQYSQIRLNAGRTSRRSFSTQQLFPSELLLDIYQNVDDPDFFYGAQRETNVRALLRKLDHEQNHQSMLSFRSAVFDSSFRCNQREGIVKSVALEMVSTLRNANHLALSNAISSYLGQQGGLHQQTDELGSFMDMQRWEFESTKQSGSATHWLVETLANVATVTDQESVAKVLDRGLAGLTLGMFRSGVSNREFEHSIADVAAFTELRRLLSSSSFDEMNEEHLALMTKTGWGKHAGFEMMSTQLVARETLFGILHRNDAVRSSCGLTRPQAALLEIQAIRESLRIGRHQDVSQYCLSRVILLTDMIDLVKGLGLKVDAAVKFDFSETLWAQNEVAGCIQILADLSAQSDLAQQAIKLSRSEILIELGQKVAEARLDTPDEIISKYLTPALRELRGNVTGADAGLVYHAFASFCDMQLQDVDSLDDFARVAKIRNRKEKEILELQQMIKDSDGQRRDQLKEYYKRAKIWFKLDDLEWRRIQENRDSLVLQCLDNYLLSLRACDGFPNDILRFVSLWLDQSDNPKANTIVRRHLGAIQSLKFAPLMNQLSSRLLNEKDDFQQLLLEVLYRVCSEHPYHSLYQIFAASKSRVAKSDNIATSRSTAASKLSELVRNKSVSGPIWVAIHNANWQFLKLAIERLGDKDLRTGSKILLKNLSAGQKLEQTINDSHTKIPPPTAHIALRVNRDYSSVPTLSRFEPQVAIAGGISAPKILSMVASDGMKHKMLVKGGNDDLRQDSIMEQVFEQVSNLLKDHRSTRQRKLGIRTYKVIPLTNNAGIIEFVQGTIPLHDYLLPAHTRYYPKDLKPKQCREEIAKFQNESLATKVKGFRAITEQFHPVMRFFFMERFLDPDVWFEKRLNYSRSTAAISILGHVLGLGDRHGHNILLDEHSGEVVHIDLGVAFEAGRVLPVPEVVPFRLTRDLVDGMGLCGVEGVFRRCCNFTLEALRADQKTIMTILDVLRYDPLYSWSISPLRLQRMQDNKDQAVAAGAGDGNAQANIPESGIVADAQNTTTAATTAGLPTRPAAKSNIDEPSEADRALTVVAKKLGKSLSVEATVNDLIRQATDEKNLAVLYCGWAAYA